MKYAGFPVILQNKGTLMKARKHDFVKIWFGNVQMAIQTKYLVKIIRIMKGIGILCTIVFLCLLLL